MKKYYIFILLSTLAMLTSCGASKRVSSVQKPSPINISLRIQREPRENSFINLDYGIRLQTFDVRSKKDIILRYDANPIFTPATTTYPSVEEFMQESGKRYMKTLGFTINSDIETDYLLSIKLSELNLSYISGTGWVSDVTMSVEVTDHNRKMVYPNVSVSGRYSQPGDSKDYAAANTAVNEAYTRAMEDIDWPRIAYFLKKSDRAADEKNKKVTGAGNTALESTVINWYIESSPKGADVNWRVVSSTPDVKNTNSKYLGSTPYEATETFDIIGLTYNNSGNVQIEVTCEKNGYVTQKKRFNLRSVIDQKEVSTKFNLVKEDE